MSSYAKIWTDIFNDEWFLSLSATQRAIWLQLIITAKMYGDTGLVSGRSGGALGSLWGCDGKTCGKILGKFLSDKKVELRKNPTGGMVIRILNYDYWQRLRKPGDKEKSFEGIPNSRENSGKIPSIIRQDKIRQDKTITRPKNFDEIPQDKIDEIKQDYPNIDFDKEFKKCKIWWSEGTKELKRPVSALRNWIDRAEKTRKQNQPEKQLTAIEQMERRYGKS